LDHPVYALSSETQDRSAWKTLCHAAVTQFEDSRVEALEHKRAVRKGFNLAATSAPGHVTTALTSVAPELDSTPINKLTDDKRSVVPMAQSIHVYPIRALNLMAKKYRKTKMVVSILRGRSN